MSATVTLPHLQAPDLHAALARRQEQLGRWADAGKFDAHPLQAAAGRYSYALSATKMARDEPGNAVLAVDEGGMWADFVLTRVRRDHHGDVVDPCGCLEYLDDYAKNPVVFFSHRSSDYPIARACDAKGELHLWSSETEMTSRAFFHNLTRESVEVFRLVSAGYLKGASIGFVPVVGQLIPAPEQSFKPGEDVLFDFGGILFKKWRLLEYSVVPVPANADAIRGFLSREKSLSDYTKRLLSPYASPRPAFLYVPGGYVKEVLSDMNTPETPQEIIQTEITSEKETRAEEKSIAPEGHVGGGEGAVGAESLTQAVENKSVEVPAVSTPSEVSVEKEIVISTGADEDDEDDDDDEDDVPYGCSVLCAVKDCLSDALEEIDSAGKKLDNKSTAGFLGRLSVKLGKALSALNKFGSKEYPEFFAKVEDGEDEDEDDEEKRKSLGAVADRLTDAVDFLEELAGDSSLKHSQKAACRHFLATLKFLASGAPRPVEAPGSVPAPAAQQPPVPTEKSAEDKRLAELGSVVEKLAFRLEEQQKKVANFIYRITGQEI